jgi:Sulfotransferase domain
LRTGCLPHEITTSASATARCGGSNMVLNLPVLIGVGPVRTGSTWVYDLLFDHPEAATTKIKESGYRAQFRPTTPSTKIFVDMSPKTFDVPNVAARIRREIRNPIILIGLRSPYERLLSCYLKWRVDDETFATMAARDCTAMGPMYLSRHIREYAATFGPERIVLFEFDKLREDPIGVAKDLQARLGLAYHESPSILHRVNAADAIPASGAAKALARVAPRLRYRLKYVWPLSELYERMYATRRTVDVKDIVSTFRDCAALFEPDIDRLEEMLSIDLTLWRLEAQRQHMLGRLGAL